MPKILMYFNVICFLHNFVSSHVYPRKPRRDPSNRRLYEHGVGYISDTARNRTHNLFRPKCAPIPLGHSDGIIYLLGLCRAGLARRDTGRFQVDRWTGDRKSISVGHSYSLNFSQFLGPLWPASPTLGLCTSSCGICLEWILF